MRSRDLRRFLQKPKTIPSLYQRSSCIYTSCDFRQVGTGVDLLRGYVQSFESLAKIKKIDFNFTTESKSINMYVDRDKIEKIMYNLLSNAFKFTPEGGRIEVSLSEIRNTLSIHPINEKSISEGQREGYLRISVSNSGSYIPPERTERIFDRFYQTDDSEIKGHEGTGIGLALTKELVELHHGQIMVESTREAGTSLSLLTAG